MTLYTTERDRARALKSGTAEDRGRWLRRLFLFTAAVMAFALLSAFVNPAFPASMRWMFAGLIVLALVQAAEAPWAARRSPPRQR